MLGEFEDAEDPEHSDEDEGAALLGALAVALRLLDNQYDEVGDDGERVERVHHAEAEDARGGARRQTKQEFNGEPDYADRLDNEERISVLRR